MSTQSLATAEERYEQQDNILEQEATDAIIEVLIPEGLLDQVYHYMRTKMVSICSDCKISTCSSGMVKDVQGGCPDSKEIPRWLQAWNRAIGALKEDRTLVFSAAVHEAWQDLSASPLTRITGRICPAPCEGTQLPGDSSGCIENRGGTPPVSIKKPEQLISDLAWHFGWAEQGFQEKIPKETNGKKIAVIGSGPAGYAAAWQLVQDGYEVTVFEKDGTAGGLMTYGIPDIKLPQDIVSQEWRLLTETGRVTVETNTNATAERIEGFQDRIWAVGKQLPMELVDNDGSPVDGSDSEGIGYAMDFLRAHQAHQLEETDTNIMSAEEKTVLVLGAGDTAEDTVHTANLQFAQSVDMAIRKVEAEFKSNRKYPSAYTPEQIGSHERHYGTIITKIEALNGGSLCAHFVTTAADGSTREWQKEFDMILNAYGFQKTLEPEMAGVSSDITRDTRGRLGFVDEALVAGDAAHIGRTTAEDLVVTALHEGVQRANGIHQKHFPPKNTGTRYRSYQW